MAKTIEELRGRVSKKVREMADRRLQELLGEMLLSEVRKMAGKSQRQVAAALGIKQPSLVKFERQTDMQISTLRKIIQALGGELEVLAKFPNGVIRIDQFSAPSESKPARRRKTAATA